MRTPRAPKEERTPRRAPNRDAPTPPLVLHAMLAIRWPQEGSSGSKAPTWPGEHPKRAPEESQEVPTTPQI
eukprot:1238001-Pyramimonas_sp.AAC.1